MRPRMRTPRKPNCQQEKNIPENLKTVNSKKKKMKDLFTKIISYLYRKY